MGIAADVELLEAEAWAHLHEAFARSATATRPAVRRWGRATAIVTRDVNVVAINRAIGLGFELPLDANQFAEVDAFFRDAGKTRWFLEWSPEALTADVDMIAARGGILGGHTVKLFGELNAMPAIAINPELTVVDLTPDKASTFLEIVAPALGVPDLARAGIVEAAGQAGWHYYLVMEGDRAIAGAAMFTDGVGAWFGLSATVPDARNRGAQTALLGRRIAEARALGCRWISAETSPPTLAPNPSLQNMSRVGMRELYHRPWFRFDDKSARAHPTLIES